MPGQRTDAHSKPCRVQGAWVRYSKDRMCHPCYTEKAPNAWHRRGTQKTGSSCYIFTVSYIVPWPAAADGDSAWGGAGNVNGIHITTVYRFDCLSKYQQWAFGPQRGALYSSRLSCVDIGRSWTALRDADSCRGLGVRILLVLTKE